MNTARSEWTNACANGWASWATRSLVYLLFIFVHCICVIEFYAVFDMCPKLRIGYQTFHVSFFHLTFMRFQLYTFRGLHLPSAFIVRFLFHKPRNRSSSLLCSIPNSHVDKFKYRCSSCWVPCDSFSFTRLMFLQQSLLFGILADLN